MAIESGPGNGDTSEMHEMRFIWAHFGQQPTDVNRFTQLQR